MSNLMTHIQGEKIIQVELSIWPKYLGSVNSFLHLPSSLPPFLTPSFFLLLSAIVVDRLQRHPNLFEISFPKGKIAV